MSNVIEMVCELASEDSDWSVSSPPLPPNWNGIRSSKVVTSGLCDVYFYFKHFFWNLFRLVLVFCITYLISCLQYAVFVHIFEIYRLHSKLLLLGGSSVLCKFIHRFSWHNPFHLKCKLCKLFRICCTQYIQPPPPFWSSNKSFSKVLTFHLTAPNF
jgi:hypothetical protein